MARGQGINRQVPPRQNAGVNFRRHALRAVDFMGDFVFYINFTNKLLICELYY